eukprot:8288601-Pyramimonas_sp.AAC.1
MAMPDLLGWNVHKLTPVHAVLVDQLHGILSKFLNRGLVAVAAWGRRHWRRHRGAPCPFGRTPARRGRGDSSPRRNPR